MRSQSGKRRLNTLETLRIAPLPNSSEACLALLPTKAIVLDQEPKPCSSHHICCWRRETVHPIVYEIPGTADFARNHDGRPAHMASLTARPQGSCSDGNTKTSDAAYRAGRRDWLTNPVNTTLFEGMFFAECAQFLLQLS